MGLIQQVLAALFGGDRNAVKEIAEVFRENAEAASARGHSADTAALEQFAAEFCARTRRTWWDSAIDGLNRLPRPVFVLGVFSMLIWTVIDPIFMSEVFTAWAIIPAPVWVLITAIVTFYFGGRQQVKGLDFQRDMAGLMTQTQAVLSQRDQLRELGAADAPDSSSVSMPPAPTSAPLLGENPAIDAWMARRQT